MNRKKLLILFISLPMLLFSNSGTAIIPQELPAFWIANLGIVIIEVIIAFRLKPSVSINKGIILVTLANILSTLLGIILFYLYLKIWEQFQYIENNIKEILLVLLILCIPTILFEFLFYQRVFLLDTFKQKIIKTTIINVLSYITLSIIIVLTLIFL